VRRQLRRAKDAERRQIWREYGRLSVFACELNTLETPMKYACIALIYFATWIAISGCSKEGSAPMAQADKSIQVGGLYATQEKDGSWRLMKVLAVDEFAVHIRTYANKLPEKPKDIDPAKLTLGGLNDPAGFGIGHFPWAKEGFLNESPVLIKIVPIKEEELEGYKLYLEAMKGRR
jgi:hypothetical protein